MEDKGASSKYSREPPPSQAQLLTREQLSELDDDEFFEAYAQGRVARRADAWTEENWEEVSKPRLVVFKKNMCFIIPVRLNICVSPLIPPPPPPLPFPVYFRLRPLFSACLSLQQMERTPLFMTKAPKTMDEIENNPDLLALKSIVDEYTPEGIR